jgi:predicted DNA binding CopG/RHH family protein
MKTAEFIEVLQNDLREISALGDEAVIEAGERLVAAIHSSASMRLIEYLGEAALEISSELPAGHVELRMSGQDAELVYFADTEPERVQRAVSQEDGTARITLRLSESLKSSVEAAAAAEGLSTNTWIVRGLSRAAASGTSGRSRKRITGFVQA